MERSAHLSGAGTQRTLTQRRRNGEGKRRYHQRNFVFPEHLKTRVRTTLRLNYDKGRPKIEILFPGNWLELPVRIGSRTQRLAAFLEVEILPQWVKHSLSCALFDVCNLTFQFETVTLVTFWAGASQLTAED